MDKYEQIMEILKNERNKELECAKTTYELMKSTKNPFKRIALEKSRKRFLDHSFGIDLAISAIKKKLGES